MDPGTAWSEEWRNEENALTRTTIRVARSERRPERVVIEHGTPWAMDRVIVHYDSLLYNSCCTTSLKSLNDTRTYE